MEDLGRVRLELERVRQVVWRRGYGRIGRAVRREGKVVHAREVRYGHGRGGESGIADLQGHEK